MFRARFRRLAGGAPPERRKGCGRLGKIQARAKLSLHLRDHFPDRHDLDIECIHARLPIVAK
jgi:hypothetical protein